MIEPFRAIAGCRLNRDGAVQSELRLGGTLILANPGQFIEARLKLPIAHIEFSHIVPSL
jgi:hypothetical protein